MLQPFNLGFNVACQHIAGKLWPRGFDISKTDAPQTYEVLRDRLKPSTAVFGEAARHIVDSNNSDHTIFGGPECAEINYCFRAWHDWCHYRGQHDFTLQGETCVARMQIDHLCLLYGVDHDPRWNDLIREEVIGQASYFASAGVFPVNQRDFARDVLGWGPIDVR